jgi:hypothetical protein
MGSNRATVIAGMFDWRLTAIMLGHILTVVGHPRPLTSSGRASIETVWPIRSPGLPVRQCGSARLPVNAQR